jgi:hypothetical protein
MPRRTSAPHRDTKKSEALTNNRPAQPKSENRQKAVTTTFQPRQDPDKPPKTREKPENGAPHLPA